MNSHKHIWSEVQTMMSLEVTDITFNTWITPLTLIKAEDRTFFVAAPNEFTKRMVTQKYKDPLEKHLTYLMKEPYEIVLVEPGEADYAKIVTGRRFNPDGQQFFELGDSKKDATVAESDPHLSASNNNHDNMLNPKYTFSTFVKGKSNQYALAAASAVAENPSSSYNPLFIWGGAGLGKTHLMQACAHQILENDPDTKVLYISSEKFTNELISALSKRNNIAFREKYRYIDVLLIDDIQFLAGKESTVEEFFHTFNDLYGANKQIIISSDRPPKELDKLEERLVSRFEWGLTADIQKPDFETRVAILHNKVKTERIAAPMEVLEYIAHNVKSNIRELEGALLTVSAYSTLMKQSDITLDLAKSALKKVIQEKEKKPITIDLIKEIVGDKYGLKMDDFQSKNRQSAIAYPRQIAMYLSRSLTSLSLVKIADQFNRDHTTVMHGIEKIEGNRAKDEEFSKELEDIIELINNA